MFEADEDPRLTDEHVRTLQWGHNRLTLLGVVHDHPASTYRAQEVVSRRDPAVLALELPPLAVPLFCAYAADRRTPPEFGGEMSAAIQAAGTDRVVGIDGPSLGFARLLIGTLARERAGLETLQDVSGAVGIATKTAVASRLAGSLAATTAVQVDIGPSWEYDVDWTDDAAVQAADEREHLGRARALSASLVPPVAKRIREEVREVHMARRLRAVGGEGDVVGIIGRDHLDSVVDELTRQGASADRPGRIG